MTLFYSLLQRRWKLFFKDTSYESTDIALIAKNCAGEIVKSYRNLPKNSQNKVFIFVIRNNFEALISYFVASYLKIRAWIINSRDLHLVSILVDSSCIAAFIMGANIKDIKTNCKRININFYEKKINLEKLYYITNNETAYFYFCTSGTTSTPKLVQFREKILIDNAKAVCNYLNLKKENNSLCFFPVNYMYGLSTMLCSFLSDSTLIFEEFNISTISEIALSYNITTLPLIGDWMISVSRVFEKSSVHIQNILNAADRLLAIQAMNILPFCDTLWNNFGQTESGPRIFYNKLQTIDDIEKTSKYGVVAPGKIMNNKIKVDIRANEKSKTTIGRMFYKTPYSFDGYVDKYLNLQKRDEWFDSGDIFLQNNRIYFWLTRAVNETKYNAKFIPTQLISADIVTCADNVKHFFSKNEKGDLNLTIDSSATEDQIKRIKEILQNKWYHYIFTINIEKIALTNTGKIIYRSQC